MAVLKPIDDLLRATHCPLINAADDLSYFMQQRIYLENSKFFKPYSYLHGISSKELHIGFCTITY